MTGAGNTKLGSCGFDGPISYIFVSERTDLTDHVRVLLVLVMAESCHFDGEIYKSTPIRIPYTLDITQPSSLTLGS